MKNQENGRSMVEMLGVLAVIGILTIAGLFAYQKAVTKSRVNKTIEAIALALQNYADLTVKNTKGLELKNEGAIIKAIDVGLADSCQKIESEVESGYQICEVPLGEMYLKFQPMDNDKYSYMLFLMMVDQDEDVCTFF